MTSRLVSQSNFTVKVNKNGSLLQTNRPVTVKNQIEEIRSIDDIPGVNNALKVDGSTIIYNANTNQYEIRPYNDDPLLNVANLYITRIFANNSLGTNGQVLFTNGNTIYWANGVTRVTAGAGLTGGGTGENVILSVNTAYIATLTANNATHAYGKTESDLVVNYAAFAGDANFAYEANVANYANYATIAGFANAAANAAFALSANSAEWANNAYFLYGKAQEDLVVNYATFAGDANFAYEANVANYANVAFNALLLNGQPSTYYTNATNIIAGTLSAARLPIIDCGAY